MAAAVAPGPAPGGGVPAGGGPGSGGPLSDLPERGGRDGRRDRIGILIGAIAGLIILVAAAVVVLPNRPKKASGIIAVTSSTVTTGDTTTSTTTATTVAAAVATTTAPPTTMAAAAHLIVGPSSIDLGLTQNSASLQVGNDGGTPINFMATASGTGLAVSPSAGTLAANTSETLTVSFTRTVSPAGPFTGSILIASPVGGANVNVTATVDAGPSVTDETANPQTVAATVCAHPASTAAFKSATITATVTSSAPVTKVELNWVSTTATGPFGVMTATVSMTMTGSVYTAALGPFNLPATIGTGISGSVEWYVTAMDNAKATGASGHHILTVACA
jgi:hypothetical protein